MLCDYCGLPTDGENLHPICAGEVSEAPLTGCPDGDTTCPACSPDYDESVGR